MTDLRQQSDSDVIRLRAFLQVPAWRERYGDTSLDDESLRAVIDGAKEWVGGRRWSWMHVAGTYLRDGKYHA